MAQKQATSQDTKAQPAQGAKPQAAQISLDAVPDQPKLAPNVELSGEMQEAGFEEQQWLIQRDGRFVQVTQLLYRIAEQIDGQHTLEEIAHAVSGAIDKKVSADNVRTLIAKTLIPKGLVLKADGSVEAPPEGQGAARSPLAVNMRMAMVSPRFIRPITATLKWLYTPVVLLAVLAAALGFQAWLFWSHGVAKSTHDALYQPGLMLVLLLLIILSAAFHEFGHASALEYGGGKVRGMGVGLYLVYPAFYTDVTDNYRLGRWARVRTDLGGFYFNLIFALGMIALWFATGKDFLLLSVVLLDLEIIHQTLPFVRLDGYWALADMTGIPDFFSQIPAYLRTMLPLPWWKGSKLPNLKGWVKAVFGLYILITVPLLAFLLFLMVKSVPRVLATGWDSFWKQMGAFSAAQHQSNYLGMLATGVQMVLLLLPTFGLLFALFNLGRRLVKAIWNWSKPTPLRRTVGALGSAAALTLVAYLWAPQLPWDRARPGPLYARTNFTPIKPEERGTIGEAVRSFSLAGAGTNAASPSGGEGTGAVPTATLQQGGGAGSNVVSTARAGATNEPAAASTNTLGAAATSTPASRVTGTPDTSATGAAAAGGGATATATAAPRTTITATVRPATSSVVPATTTTTAAPTATTAPRPTVTATVGATVTASAISRPTATVTPLPSATAPRATPTSPVSRTATATRLIGPTATSTSVVSPLSVSTNVAGTPTPTP